jgi:hypothetical protein
MCPAATTATPTVDQIPTIRVEDHPLAPPRAQGAPPSPHAMVVLPSPNQPHPDRAEWRQARGMRLRPRNPTATDYAELEDDQGRWSDTANPDGDAEAELRQALRYQELAREASRIARSVDEAQQRGRVPVLRAGRGHGQSRARPQPRPGASLAAPVRVPHLRRPSSSPDPSLGAEDVVELAGRVRRALAVSSNALAKARREIANANRQLDAITTTAFAMQREAEGRAAGQPLGLELPARQPRRPTAFWKSGAGGWIADDGLN